MVFAPDELIGIASQHVRRIDLGNGSDAGTVAAALETVGGNIYTGVCLDLPSGLGTCAEHGAILDMLKCGETDIAQIVAVGADGILPPCGRCRELLLQVSLRNADTKIVLSETDSAPLSELLPLPGPR